MSKRRRGAGEREAGAHLLEIAEVSAGSAGGKIGISRCPGKPVPRKDGPSQGDLVADLDAVAAWKAVAILTLIDDDEIEALGIVGFGDEVRARGLAWHHLPIEDFSEPNRRFEKLWKTTGPELLGHLRAGRRVHMHCNMGLGRAGTIAARLLVELGLPPQTAIERIRLARPHAIQTDAQMDYVLRLRAARVPHCQGTDVRAGECEKPTPCSGTRRLPVASASASCTRVHTDSATRRRWPRTSPLKSRR